MPYAGGERSAGGRCHSRERGGTGSSQSGPEVRSPSAPPLCGEQSPSDESRVRGCSLLPESHLRPGCPPSRRRAPRLVSSSAKWAPKSMSGSRSLNRTALLPGVSLSCPGHTPGVQEDELHVQAGAEHEHVAVQLDFRDGAGRQRVTHSHKAHILVAAIKGGHVQAVLAYLQVAAAVNDLQQRARG